MEKRLSEAALQGDLESLRKILEQDSLILDRIIVSCVSETPLHIASTLGHLSLVKEFLIRKPELASELDSTGCSPLHLAAAKGHVDIVEELLRADAEVFLVRNSDGRNALHMAAIKGRAAVIAVMVRFNPECTRLLTDRGETCLHLCVKWNRLEELKFLAEFMRRNGEFLNWKDCEGNSAFHIAVSKKNIEIINHLLTLNGLELNASNKNGWTPMDVLRQSPRDLRDMDIEHALIKAGALSFKDLNLITDEWIPEKVRQMTKKPSSGQSNANKPVAKNKNIDWLGRKRSALMVVASLIATVAFQAALTPPGGVWQDDRAVDDKGNLLDIPRSAGKSVMAYNDPQDYGAFMILNTIAFLASLSIILLLVSGLPLKRRHWMWVQMVIMWTAITAQVGTYFVILKYMSPDYLNAALRKVTEISVLTWLTLMVVVFVGNVIRLNLWVLRKYGIIEEREIRRSASVVDNEDENDA